MLAELEEAWLITPLDKKLFQSVYGCRSYKSVEEKQKHKQHKTIEQLFS